MTRPESHRIDERAKRAFNSAIPDSWVPREQHPDYRIDYTIEVFDGDNSTALFWHVQLKGVKAPRFLKSITAISYSVEVDHLEYYLNKINIPVFLVVVDTTNEEGWWVFLQHYIKTNVKGDWRKQSTANIRLPLANSIGDSAALEAAISDATQYMRELHPSSITASINAERERLESLDPRFQVGINATLDETEYSLTPKEETNQYRTQNTRRPLRRRVGLDGRSAGVSSPSVGSCGELRHDCDVLGNRTKDRGVRARG